MRGSSILFNLLGVVGLVGLLSGCGSGGGGGATTGVQAFLPAGLLQLPARLPVLEVCMSTERSLRRTM
jgi:hypothetical protein